jgi:4-hydroxybenzoate polyprenyltransferase
MNAHKEADLTTTPRAAGSRLARLLAFACETHPPLTYTVVALGWSLSLATLLQWGHGAVAITPPLFLLSLTFFLVLLYLRAVDEVKDLDYDRLHNPDRPLVRGAVSVREAWLLAASVGLVILAICATLDVALVLLAIVEMLYAIGLLTLERNSRFFRNNILLNLCVTFPVSAVLNLYVVIYLAGRDLAPALPQIITVVAAHMCIFLHLEFGRKLKKPQFTAAGENGYVIVLGIGGAMAVCALLGIAACTLASFQLWQGGAGLLAALPWLALVPSVLGFAKFVGATDRAPELKPLFGGAMILFFYLNITAVLCAGA